jgi:hypothetical protein
MTGQNASLELGEIDFVHGVAVDRRGFDLPSAIAVDNSVNPPRLLVADEGNNRVLGYKSATGFAPGAAPDLVLGQNDPFSNLQGILTQPDAMAVDSTGGLWVGAFDAVRGENVLDYFPSPFTSTAHTLYLNGRIKGNGIALSGPNSFLSTNCAIAKNFRVYAYSTIFVPDGTYLHQLVQMCAGALAVDPGGILYAADPSNNRILIFNSGKFDLNHSPVPGGVLGQPDFKSTDCNHGGISAASLCGPAGLAFDRSGKLYVADAGNHRILEYDRPQTNRIANQVVGQGNSFTSSACNAGGVNAGSLCMTSNIFFGFFPPPTRGSQPMAWATSTPPIRATIGCWHMRPLRPPRLHPRPQRQITRSCCNRHLTSAV